MDDILAAKIREMSKGATDFTQLLVRYTNEMSRPTEAEFVALKRDYVALKGRHNDILDELGNILADYHACA